MKERPVGNKNWGTLREHSIQSANTFWSHYASGPVPETGNTAVSKTKWACSGCHAFQDEDGNAYFFSDLICCIMEYHPCLIWFPVESVGFKPCIRPVSHQDEENTNWVLNSSQFFEAESLNPNQVKVVLALWQQVSVSTAERSMFQGELCSTDLGCLGSSLEKEILRSLMWAPRVTIWRIVMMSET